LKVEKRAAISGGGAWHFVAFPAGLFGELAHDAEFLVAAFEPFGDGQGKDLFEMLQAVGFKILRSGGNVRMRAAGWFRNDFIGEPQLKQVPGGNAQRGGSLGRRATISP